MAVSPGDIISVTARNIFRSTDDMVNKLHVRVGTPPDTNTDVGIGDELRTWIGQWFLELAPLISSAVDPVDVTLYNVTDDRPIGQFNWGGSYVGGTGGSQPLPPQCSMLLLLRTGLKRRLGRVYLPVFTEAAQDSGFWEPGVISDVEDTVTFLTAVLDGPDGGQYQPVVYSPTDGLGYTITSVRVMPQVSVLHSRRTGRGS